MVYGAISRVLFPVAAVALVGAGVWGYQEHNEKNSILIKTENQYQRAFHDLNHHIDKLSDELGKSLVVNSQRQVTPALTNVWRLAYSAQSDVGQLPLTLMPFHNTEEFLAKVADFSHSVAVRDLGKKPLSDQEHKTLSTLYDHSKHIRKQLRDMQTKVLDQKLRWMDVEVALASDDKKTDNSIIDGFKTIDKNVQEYSEIDWGASIHSLDQKKKMRVKGLDGKPVNQTEAERIARDFVGSHDSRTQVQINANDHGKGQGYSAYSITIKDGKRKNPIHLDVSKKGGKVLWMMNERDVKQEKISLQQAQDNAAKFLKERGYKNMVPTESDSYHGMGVFTFVPEENGVRIYPDAVTVKVALDNGEVNGFHATQYLFNHKDGRKLQQKRISIAQARKSVSPRIKVTDQGLAVIEGKNDGKEVLCYEFRGEHAGVPYQIFVNAENGEEEEIVRLDNEPGFGDNK
ncbi:germination protein YpeB [Brevibacillus sp. B_LB10_24]|uniref:germination protein YpeB n=1 Tax=Brevibacillus sp. B_LB10_24 TaxID=3380645 RepID=UPI0038B794E2